MTVGVGLRVREAVETAVGLDRRAGKRGDWIKLKRWKLKF